MGGRVVGSSSSATHTRTHAHSGSVVRQGVSHRVHLLPFPLPTIRAYGSLSRGLMRSLIDARDLACTSTSCVPTAVTHSLLLLPQSLPHTAPRSH